MPDIQDGGLLLKMSQGTASCERSQADSSALSRLYQRSRPGGCGGCGWASSRIPESGTCGQRATSESRSAIWSPRLWQYFHENSSRCSCILPQLTPWKVPSSFALRLDYSEWSGERFRRWATEKGGHVLAVTDAILRSRQVEQQSYRTCRALLALGERNGWDELEEACAKACEISRSPSYKTVKTLLARMIEERAADPDANAFVRGRSTTAT